jgi:glycosyltransferase involved in cell wall biosynthesis/capsular polysaccharide biosynthesis protein
MNDPAAGLSILHVIVRAGPTNSQYNEHCLPVLADRRITVCSIFPAEVTPPPALTLFEGDGTVRGGFRALRRALDFASYDVVHVHAPASGILTLLAYARLRRSRRDLVFTIHNSWQNFRRRNRLFLRVVLALFPMVVVCGIAARDSMPKQLLRRHRHALAVVPNGVDVDRVNEVLAQSEQAPRTTPGRTVVSVGRLIPMKDPLLLLNAFADAADDDDGLVLVGGGPLRDDVARGAHDLGIAERVVLTGLVPRDEVYRLVRESDVFVSTSRGEGLPVAMLEAMACGCPVIASDIPPHREIASVAQLIPLVPAGDRAAFARAIDRVLSLSAQEREQVAAHLRSCVAEHFSVQAMNRGYGEVYAKVTSSAGRRRANLRPAEQLPAEEATLPEKLRRRAAFIAVATTLGAVGGFGFAQLQSPVFKSEATLMVGTSGGSSLSEDELKFSAALAAAYSDLARREPVLGPVAASGFADSWRQLQPNVQVQQGTKNPQLIQLSVYADTPKGATALANAVTHELKRMASPGTASSQQRFITNQLRTLERTITVTSSNLEAALLALDATPEGERTAVLARVEALRQDIAALQGSYAQLERLDTANAGRLSVVDTPWTQRSPLRPTPIVLTIAGATVGLALAIGLVHLSVRRRPAPSAPVPDTSSGPMWGAMPNQKRGNYK